MSALVRRPQLESLQALRGLAAGAVVFEHLHFHSDLRQGPGLVPDWFSGGHLGVDLFFVLSGFILLHVHRRDLGQAGQWRRYAWRRFVRIWPLLALLNTFKLVYLLAGGTGASPHKTDLGVIVSSYLCLPYPGWPLLDVAWTLRHEVLFYALFGLAVAFGARLGRILMGAAALALLAVALSGGSQGWPWWAQFLATPLHWHFLFGLSVAWSVSRPQAQTLLEHRAFPALALGTLLLAGLALWQGASLHLATGRDEPRVLFAAGAALLVWSLVLLERRRPRPLPRALTELGDASYSLYLWHGFVIVGGLTFWGQLPEALRAWPRSYLVVLTVLAFMSSILVYRWVERPILRALRS